MKTFFSVFFAILAAAIVILAALWAKSRVDDWNRAWRSCDAEISAIINSETALTRAARYSSTLNSPEVAMHEASIALQRIEDDQARVAEIEERMKMILENKPFGLPLTNGERKELESVTTDLQKHPARPR